jgi:ubiquinone biosynthesis protein
MKGVRVGKGARARFGEIVAILKRHHVVKGLTPGELRAIFEELGPTYVKLGQLLSTRSDILPEAYCQELARLRTDVAPMPIEAVREVVEAEYGLPCGEVFRSIDPKPLGSASIAQAHLAVLPDGRRVVAKVQRPNIRETMAQDIQLLKKAAKLARFTPAGGAVDLSMVLDELWKAAQHELDFLEEAENLREFAKLNAGDPHVACPAVIGELATTHILVLEYVEGIQIDDAEALKKAGNDPHELASRLAGNFIKQVLDDRFFHADPHPGNIRVRAGKIVWLDLGMMGRLSGADGAMFTRFMEAVAKNDADQVTDVLLALGVCRRTPDRARLSLDIEVLLSKYRQMPLASINAGSVLGEFLTVARRHEISMPASLTMLGRSVVILESVLTALDPDTNLLKIMSAHLQRDAFDAENLRERMEKLLLQLSGSSEKLTAIPAQVSDALARVLSGRVTLNVNLAGQEQEGRSKDRRSARLSLSIVAASMILGAGVFSLSGAPGLWGLPWPSSLLLTGAAGIFVALVSLRGGRR